jgi:hypothetical protein
MESKAAEFENHYNLCRKHKNEIQKLMTDDFTKVSVKAHNHVLEFNDSNNKELIDQLCQEYKLSKNSLYETMYFGKLTEELLKVKLAKQQEEQEQKK